MTEEVSSDTVRVTHDIGAHLEAFRPSRPPAWGAHAFEDRQESASPGLQQERAREQPKTTVVPMESGLALHV